MDDLLKSVPDDPTAVKLQRELTTLTDFLTSRLSWNTRFRKNASFIEPGSGRSTCQALTWVTVEHWNRRLLIFCELLQACSDKARSCEPSFLRFWSAWCSGTVPISRQMPHPNPMAQEETLGRAAGWRRQNSMGELAWRPLVFARVRNSMMSFLRRPGESKRPASCFWRRFRKGFWCCLLRPTRASWR